MTGYGKFAGTSAADGTEMSSYVYPHDLLGRRISKNGEHYGYNVRDELISADNVSYAYDDIGNRTVAEGKTYTANNLNQYTAIDDFTPRYDADGNQKRFRPQPRQSAYRPYMIFLAFPTKL